MSQENNKNPIPLTGLDEKYHTLTTINDDDDDLL
jgi:hypothetical protein